MKYRNHLDSEVDVQTYPEKNKLWKYLGLKFTTA